MSNFPAQWFFSSAYIWHLLKTCGTSRWTQSEFSQVPFKRTWGNCLNASTPDVQGLHAELACVRTLDQARELLNPKDSNFARKKNSWNENNSPFQASDYWLNKENTRPQAMRRLNICCQSEHDGRVGNVARRPRQSFPDSHKKKKLQEHNLRIILQNINFQRSMKLKFAVETGASNFPASSTPAHDWMLRTFQCFVTNTPMRIFT